MAITFERSMKREYQIGPDGVGRYVLVENKTPPSSPVAPPVVPSVAVTNPSSLVVAKSPAPVYNVEQTSNPKIRKITGDLIGGAPLFTNLRGLEATRGFEAVSPEVQAAKDADFAEVRATSPLFADDRAQEAALAAISAQGGFRTELTASERAALAAGKQARAASTLLDARTALGLGITNSLERGIGPEGLKAATSGLAELQPPATSAGDYAGLLNAQTAQVNAQNRQSLGEQRLTQEQAIANARLKQENIVAGQDIQTESEKQVIGLATKLAADPLTGAIDPAKFAIALAQANALLGVTFVGGVGAAVMSEEDAVKEAVAAGYKPEEARALYRAQHPK